MSLFGRLRRIEKGQGLVEYGLILALVSVVAVGSLGGVGEKVTDTFHTIAPKQSTLVVDSGGKNDIEITKDIGEFSTILSPTKMGYRFGGWDESGSGQLLGLGDFMPKRTDNELRNQDYWMSNVSVYNNTNNGTVTHRRVNGSGVNMWDPLLRNGYIRITSEVGEQLPGRGGYFQYTWTDPNHTYYQVFVANIPKGYRVSHHYNPVGDNPKWSWLTDREGTGKPETYVVKLETSNSGNFSTFGHIAIYGDDDVPVSWDLYYSHVMNATDIDENESKVFLFDHQGDKSIKPKWIAK